MGRDVEALKGIFGKALSFWGAIGAVGSIVGKIAGAPWSLVLLVFGLAVIALLVGAIGVAVAGESGVIGAAGMAKLGRISTENATPLQQLWLRVNLGVIGVLSAVVGVVALVGKFVLLVFLRHEVSQSAEPTPSGSPIVVTDPVTGQTSSVPGIHAPQASDSFSGSDLLALVTGGVRVIGALALAMLAFAVLARPWELWRSASSSAPAAPAPVPPATPRPPATPVQPTTAVPPVAAEPAEFQPLPCPHCGADNPPQIPGELAKCWRCHLMFRA